MQVQEDPVRRAPGDDQVQPTLVLDVVVTEHVSIRVEDAEDVRLRPSGDERVAILHQAIAVLLDGESGGRRRHPV